MNRTRCAVLVLAGGSRPRRRGRPCSGWLVARRPGGGMADTHPAGARRPLGRDHGQPSRLGAPIPDRCVHLDTRPAVGSVRHHGWKAVGARRIAAWCARWVGVSIAACRNRFPVPSRACAPPRRGPGVSRQSPHPPPLPGRAQPRGGRDRLAAQCPPSGRRTAQTGSGHAPTRPTGRGMSTTVLRQRLRRQGRPSRSARVTRTSPGARSSTPPAGSAGPVRDDAETHRSRRPIGAGRWSSNGSSPPRGTSASRATVLARSGPSRGHDHLRGRP